MGAEGGREKRVAGDERDGWGRGHTHGQWESREDGGGRREG